MSADSAVIKPGGPQFDEALRDAVWNGRKPSRQPAAIIRAQSDQDIVDAVALANSSGWNVGVRAGGHAWAAYGVTEGNLLVDLSEMDGIEYDDVTGIVSIEPGVRSQQLATFLAGEARYFPGGHCPTVGVSGFTLGGGFGFNSRVVGPASFSIVAIDAVLADGELRRYDDADGADVVWASRGSGPGFFGVVARLHLQTYEAPAVVGASMQAYPIALYDQLAPWFLELAEGIDPRVNPVLIGAHLPGQDGTVLMIANYCFADSEDEMRGLLQPLEDCPLIDQAAVRLPPHISSIDAQYALLDQLYPPEHRYLTDNIWAEPDRDGFIAAAKTVFETLPSDRSHAIWAPWVEQRKDGAAFGLQSRLSMNVYAVYEDEADDQAMMDWHLPAMARIAPFSNGGGKVNDSNLYERPMKVLSDESAARLEDLRDQYDPDRLFTSYPHKPV